MRIIILFDNNRGDITLLLGVALAGMK